MYEVENELVKRQLIGVHKKLQAKLSTIHDELDGVKGLASDCQDITKVADGLIVITDNLLDSVRVHLLLLQAELIKPNSLGEERQVFAIGNYPMVVDAFGIPVPVDTPDTK